jgi:glutathione S-transferase
MATAPWLAGETLSLADLYAAPMFDYFLMTPEGREMLRGYDNLTAWWSRIAVRPSMKSTQPI